MPLYWIWLAQLKGMSLLTKHQLLAEFGDAERIYREADVTGKDLKDAMQILERCQNQNVRILTFADPQYPQRLRYMEDPPLVLYCKGTLPDWDAMPAIGVVGTRKATSYGMQTAYLMGSQIAACGGLVVSGAAAGVDAKSMEGALDASKPAVGVLGCAIDVVYPAANRRLYRRTEENGCLISEYPPGIRTYPTCFLQRNRIISGLSQGVLVVEAPEKSGALSTARHAMQQGRDLFVVPGNVGVESCAGSNSLLLEGAMAALTGWDVVKHYENLYPGIAKNSLTPVSAPQKIPQKTVQEAYAKETTTKKPIDNSPKSTYSVINKRPAGVNDQESGVYDLLTAAPQLIDNILDASSLPASAVQSVLTRLVIKGLAVQHPDGRVSRK